MELCFISVFDIIIKVWVESDLWSSRYTKSCYWSQNILGLHHGNLASVATDLCALAYAQGRRLLSHGMLEQWQIVWQSCMMFFTFATLKKIICCIYLCLLVYLCKTVALILLSRCSKQSQAYLLNLSTQHILNHRTQTHVVVQLQYVKLTNLKKSVQHGCLVFIK